MLESEMRTARKTLYIKYWIGGTTIYVFFWHCVLDCNETSLNYPNRNSFVSFSIYEYMYVVYELHRTYSRFDSQCKIKSKNARPKGAKLFFAELCSIFDINKGCALLDADWILCAQTLLVQRAIWQFNEMWPPNESLTVCLCVWMW